MEVSRIKYRILIVLFFPLLLMSCDSYQVSEEILNSTIEEKIAAQPQQYMFIIIDDPIADLKVRITQVYIDLQESDDATTKIHISTEVTGILYLGGERVDIATHALISTKAGLVVENGKVYLSDPQITNIHIYGSSLNDGLLRSSIEPFHRIVEKALSGYFYVYPVYELVNSTFEESIQNSIKSVSVKDDKLLLEFY